MHRIGRFDPGPLVVPDAYRAQSAGYRRQVLVDGTLGSVPMGFAACELGAGGRIAGHVHSYEECPRDFFWTGVGCVHAFDNRTHGTVRWLETSAPHPPRHHSYRFTCDWDYLTRLLGSGARDGQTTPGPHR